MPPTRPRSSIPLEAQRGYQATGDQWSPGFFHVELTGAAPVTLVASVEPWETLLAMPFDEALRAEREPPVAADRRGTPRWSGQTGPGRRSPSRRAGSRGRPVPDHSHRQGRGRRPRACRRRGGPHGDRRLSLVHRLGARHDDQPRGADPEHRPRCGGGVYPPHLRAITSAMGSSPTCFPRAAPTAFTTPRMPRSGSSTRSIATWNGPMTARRCWSSCPA